MGRQSHPEYTLRYLYSNYKTSSEFKERYKINQTIGEGGQALVKEGVDLLTDKEVAMKIFKKRRLNLFGLSSAYLESSLTKQLGHPNILKRKAFYEDNDYVCIVFELMASDLRQFLIEHEAPMSEIVIKEIFYQMV